MSHYILAQVPAAFAIETQYTCSRPKDSFVIANRQSLGEIQNLEKLSAQLDKSSPDGFLATMSDFHLLVYLAKMENFQIGVRFNRRKPN